MTVLALALPVLAAESVKLSSPPEGERWFSVNMNDERVGFAHLTIRGSDDGYRITSESAAKMRGMGFSRESSSKDSYQVRRDLSVSSFTADSRVDGSPLRIQGEAGPTGIRMFVESKDGKKERTLKVKGPVYPPDVLNIYPLMQGAVPGKSFRIPMLDLESAKVKQVKVKVIGMETLPDGIETVHLRNDLYPIVDNDIWVDLKGNTVKEAVREDLIITLAENEALGKFHLAEDALAKKDMVLYFSLIPVLPPIERPEQLKKLSVELTGIPEAMPILQGQTQQGTREGNGAVVYTMPNPSTVPTPAGGTTASEDLRPSSRIPSDAPEIIAKKDEILGTEKDPAKRAMLLMQWVSKEIKVTNADTQPPLDTLAKRSGNSESHARLYTALARASGIPTRLVSGIVFLPGQGFLYHSWVESHLGGWTPVDPTLGEFPASLTHIKIVEGDSPDEIGALAGVIGRLNAKVLEKVY